MSTYVSESPTITDRSFSPDELEAFDRDGFAIARGLVDDDVRSAMLEATFAGLADRSGSLEYEAELGYPGAPDSRNSHGGNTIRRLRQAHARHEVFTRWLTDPALLNRLRQLLGPRVLCPLAHHNCIMTKQPRHSSDTGWHRDIRYWAFERPDLVSVWVALGREHAENGALQLIPGSHRWNLGPEDFDEAEFLREDAPEVRDRLDTRVLAEMEPGDALFFHCRTFHAATRNRSAEPKFSAVFTFRGEGNPPRPGSRSASLPELLLPVE